MQERQVDKIETKQTEGKLEETTIALLGGVVVVVLSFTKMEGVGDAKLR